MSKNKYIKYTDQGLLLNVVTGEVSIIKAIIDSGVSIEAKDSRKWTALHYAVDNGRAEVVELLLARGASVDEQTLVGRTSLHIAALRKHEEIARMLIDAGASLDIKDHYAAKATPADYLKECLPELYSELPVAQHHSITAVTGDVDDISFCLD